MSPKQRDYKPLAIALLSGNGAGALVTVTLAFQMIEKVQPSMAGWTFVIAAVFLVLFLLGAMGGWVSLLNLIDEERNEFERNFEVAQLVMAFTCAALLVLMGALAVMLFINPEILLRAT